MAITDGMSPADLAAVTGNGRGSDEWGGNGAYWIIILFLFIFCGWGNNGYGNNAGAADNYVLASDFATLQRQIDSATNSLERKGDSIQNGLCDGFYAQNSTMLTGFSNAELSRANQQAALMQQLNANNVTALQNANAIQAQLAQCCCDNRAAIADTNYNVATQANGIQTAISSGFCQTNYNNASNTRDIIEAQNAGTRAILDKLASQELAAKDAQISAQQQRIFGLQLSASQQAQNAYLLNQLRPAPIPAFTVGTPYQFSGCNAYSPAFA